MQGRSRLSGNPEAETAFRDEALPSAPTPPGQPSPTLPVPLFGNIASPATHASVIARSRRKVPMIIKNPFRSPLHEHPDPAQRVLGVSELPPDSDELAGLLAADPAPEVRAAAAGRCAKRRRACRSLANGVRFRSQDRDRRRAGPAPCRNAGRRKGTGAAGGRRCTDAIRSAVRAFRAATRTAAASPSPRSATRTRWSISRWSPNTPKRGWPPRSACRRRRGSASSPTRRGTRTAA